MTKNDLVERLAEEHELTKVLPANWSTSLFDTIMAAAQKARSLDLRFWPLRGRRACGPQGRNPRTEKP